MAKKTNTKRSQKVIEKAPKEVAKKTSKQAPKKNYRKIIGLCSAGLLVLALIIGYILMVKNKQADDTSVVTGVKSNNLSGEAQQLEVGQYGARIMSGGIYELSEDIIGGSVTINAGKADVQLILNSVVISNTNGPAINVVSADNVYIELKGENEITATATEDENGAIYSKSDLAITGEGSLILDSNIDGIVGKDDLEISGGKLDITASDEGIVGKDSIKISGGDISITAGDHGLKTSNEEEKGDMEITGGDIEITSSADALHSVASIVISGGNLEIAAGDDGLHADKTIVIDDGKVEIKKSYEGVEGGEITVNGGEITVVSSDDGFNAAGGSDTGAAQDPFAGDVSKNLTINGGSIYINASGDGLDSNGNLYINGGTVYVDGPTNNGNGAVDYGDRNCEFKITGGTLIAVGSSGMAVNATSATQPSVLMNLNSAYTGPLYFGEIGYEPSKSYSSVLISSPNLSLGESYTLFIDGAEIQTVSISDMVVGTGNAGMMPGPGMDQQGGQQGGPIMPGRR